MKFIDWVGILSICVSFTTIFILLRTEAKQRIRNKRLEILQQKTRDAEKAKVQAEQGKPLRGSCPKIQRSEPR